MQLVLDAGLPNLHLFAWNWATFKLLRQANFLPWVKGLKYCINYIWLKCLYWNILYSTYDKTVLDVKLCEGWPLVGSLLAVFMIICIQVKYVFNVCKYNFEFLYLAYGHCATLGPTLTSLITNPNPPISASCPTVLFLKLKYGHPNVCTHACPFRLFGWGCRGEKKHYEPLLDDYVPCKKAGHFPQRSFFAAWAWLWMFNASYQKMSAVE